VHLGHRLIIEEGKKEARRTKTFSAVLTFLPHPANVLNPEKQLKMLSTFQMRMRLLEDLGIDKCFVVRFDREFSKLPAEDFVKNILIRSLNAKTLVVGCDFRFGAGSRGGVGLLKSLSKELGFKLKVIDCLKKNAKKISSSLIRKFLKAGRIQDANKFLGRLYSIQGRVVRGMRLGGKIGIPTANIDYDKEVMLPLGIFSGFLSVEGKINRGVIFSGFKTMFVKGNNTPVIEAHLFNFKKNIYGKKVEIFFVRKIRDEKRFDSIYGLKRAIEKDIKEAKKD
jgi:riboflavin kinase/FMN adenylyltransferase